MTTKRRRPQAIRRPSARRLARRRHDSLWALALFLGLMLAVLLWWPEPVRAGEPRGGPGLSGLFQRPNDAGQEAWVGRAVSAAGTSYEQAAAHYDLSPGMLQALHLVESSGAWDSCLANLEGSGAIGPFQFKPATFGAYGLDADGDGQANICGFIDSLFSAARYLQALGATADPTSPATHRALKRYGTDPVRVVALTR